jgi:hypothetical protein
VAQGWGGLAFPKFARASLSPNHMALAQRCLTRDAPDCLSRDLKSKLDEFKSKVDENNPFAAPLRTLSSWTQSLLQAPQESDSFNKKASWKSAKRFSSTAASFKRERKKLNLSELNPSLYVVGLETVERVLPRYLSKAGIACERMQHAGLPVEAIRRVLEALFVVPDGASEQSEEHLREVFSLVDASGDVRELRHHDSP